MFTHRTSSGTDPGGEVDNRSKRDRAWRDATPAAEQEDEPDGERERSGPARETPDRRGLEPGQRQNRRDEAERRHGQATFDEEADEVHVQDVELDTRGLGGA